MTISKENQHQTKSGYEVRIYATDAGGKYPVHGAYKEDGDWVMHYWTKDGFNVFGLTGSMDLVEVKPKPSPKAERTVFMNVYPKSQDLHATSRAANYNAKDGRITCLEIYFKCEEG